MTEEDKAAQSAWMAEHNPESLLADGFEEAFLGFASHPGQPPVAVYDSEKCVMIMMVRDGLSFEDALEHFMFNVEGAYVGPYTPLYLTPYHPTPPPMVRRPLPPDDDRVSRDLAPDDNAGSPASKPDRE